MTLRLQWTPEIDAEIAALLGLNKSMREVADFLSVKYGVPVTRNMVIGRRFRTNPNPRRIKVDLFGKSLDELNDKDCRFAVSGDTVPYRFCGKRVQAGSSYCPHHHGIAWKKAEPPEKREPNTMFKAGKPRHLMVAA